MFVPPFQLKRQIIIQVGHSNEVAKHTIPITINDQVCPGSKMNFEPKHFTVMKSIPLFEHKATTMLSV